MAELVLHTIMNLLSISLFILISLAPAAIPDLKSAILYLRHFDREMPGDAEKIITDGTSSGGAMPALMGTTGNAREFEPYLEAMGAYNRP